MLTCLIRIRKKHLSYPGVGKGQPTRHTSGYGLETRTAAELRLALTITVPDPNRYRIRCPDPIARI